MPRYVICRKIQKGKFIMKTFTVLAALAVAAWLGAAETIDLQNTKAWGDPASMSIKDGVISVKGKQLLFISEAFTVDPAKSYSFTVSCRSGNGKNSAFMPVVIQYDRDGRSIGTGRVKTVNGTFTELLAPVKAGDKTLLVKDAKLWPKKRLLVIAFNAKEDYSDLPNTRIAWSTITKITEQNGSYLVTLDKAIPFSAPAGGIRLHHNGPLYTYPLGGRNTSGSWDNLSGKISGVTRNDFMHNKWAPGAVTAKFGLQINAKEPDAVTEVKNLKLVIE